MTNWMSFGEWDLIVFGTLAAVLLAIIRLASTNLSPKIPVIGFIALTAGYVWVLSEWSKEFGSSTAVTQGIGLWLGLAAGVAGALICLTDTGK